MSNKDVTRGINSEGFEDPRGVFPKKDYYNLIDRAFADLSNDYFDYYGWYKNQTLLQLFCESHNVDLFEFNNHSVPPMPFAFGADGKHPGQEWHDAMCKHISETVNA